MVPYAPREAFGPQWGEPAHSVSLPSAMSGWFPDWEARRDRMVDNGLPVFFDRVIVTGDLVAFRVYIPEAHLPRSHVDRGFDLHLSIGFLSTWRERGLDMDGVKIYIDELNRRFHGHRVVKVGRLGHGGAAILHVEDEIAKDPIFNVLHEFGGYEWREPHISL